ncbi:MAG: hypothetical protein IJ770_05505 [Alphaproteobacteria bacterium]|nr:hypothetical protein [Alphaproteobacteria bacterium]
MLKLTKTGIGLLTRQYRSVLHKCFLINIGAWITSAFQNIANTISSVGGAVREFANNFIAAIKLPAEPFASLFGEGTLNTFNVLDDSFVKHLYEKVVVSYLGSSAKRVISKKLLMSTAMIPVLVLGAAIMTPNEAKANIVCRNRYTGVISTFSGTGAGCTSSSEDIIYTDDGTYGNSSGLAVLKYESAGVGTLVGYLTSDGIQKVSNWDINTLYAQYIYIQGTSVATQTWVNNQGFLKSADLSGYITESDLSGYLTDTYIKVTAAPTDNSPAHIYNADGSVAIGTLAGVYADYSVALGEAANAYQEGTTALGTGANAGGYGSVALGAGSVASEVYVVSVGSGHSGDGHQYRRIVNVANGTADHDAVNYGQIKNFVTASTNALTNYYTKLDSEEMQNKTRHC